MKAYKYFDSSLKTKILDEGRFRIGTLYDYRLIESHGGEIGDSREGKLGAHSQILSWSSSDPILRNEHADSFVKGNAVVFREGSSISFKPGGKIMFNANGVSLQNVSLRSELQVQDLYVFSFSSEFDPKLMRKMDYDACSGASSGIDCIRSISTAVVGGKIHSFSGYLPSLLNYLEMRFGADDVKSLLIPNASVTYSLKMMRRD